MDELVKRLRAAAKEWRAKNQIVGVGETRYDVALEEAADVIKELQKAVNFHKFNSEFWEDKFNSLADEKWISVTERLPENIDEEVLVCTEDYGVNSLGFVTVATYGVNGWLECWERKTYLTAVTHWMPLPEPPKEET